MHVLQSPCSSKDQGQPLPSGGASRHDVVHDDSSLRPISGPPETKAGSPAKQQKPMPEDPFFLEICAGSARVTTCLQSLGLRSSFGVDHKRQKHAGKILVADLTTKTGQDLCLSWINSPSCMGVFCAPHAVHAAAQEAYQFSCTMV